MDRGTWHCSLGVSSVVDAFVRSEVLPPRAGTGISYVNLVQGSDAATFCEGSCPILYALRGLTSCSECLQELQGGVRYARKDDRLEVSKGREDVREVFQQRGSGAKRKLSRCGRNQIGLEDAWNRETVIALYVTTSEEGLNMRQSRWMKLFNEYGFEAKYHLGKANVVVESWSRRKSEATNKFWIDVGPPFGEMLTNQWLSIKGLQDCCYNLSYPSKSGERITKDMVVKLPSVSSGYDAIWGCGDYHEGIEMELHLEHCVERNVVKVRWDLKRGPELTWERKDRMRSTCPQLFVDRANA
ncbi:hypothetical protein Tco_0939030 [Tanacetum coccineum]|uniref:Uncharacterized protein n=1 Tax=Tanacetum coccineum TaxID=301880 RepID=A0ABQ5DIW4_9ASTR